jgi:translation initiation factor 3 subunit B
MGSPPNVLPYFLDNDGVNALPRWPVFTFSADDKFFAAAQKNDLLSVYDTSTCKLHKPRNSARGKSIQIEGLEDFSWSPDPDSAIVAFWAPERANIPAKVQLVSMPAREVIREKLWYQVSDIQFHWHPRGDFLCVRVKRHTKTRKTYYTSIEIFRMKDRNIPVETFEIREQVLDFCWEPFGSRFGVVHSTQETRTNVSFYDLHGVTRSKGCDKLFTLTDRECNTLSWQPHGGNVILLGAGSPHNGRLEFYSVDEDECLMEAEHYMCSKVEWDPSGRTVASIVTQRLGGTQSLRGSSEAGYFLWSMHGIIIERVQKQKFYQFSWRPRPLTLLTPKQLKLVGKNSNMKKFTKRYSKQDALRLDAHGAENAKKKIKLRDTFRAQLAAFAAKTKPRHAEMVALRGFDTTDDSLYKIVSAQVTVVLSEKDIVYVPPKE